MRKLLLVLAFAPGAVMAAPCGALSTYHVKGLDFHELDARAAISEVIAATPYRLVFRGTPPAKRVSAEGVSGPVKDVLQSLTSQVGLTYSAKDCELDVSTPAASTFVLRAGEQVDEALASWLHENGYTLYWDAPKFRAGGALRLSAPVDAVLQNVVEILKGNGVSVSADIYENNVVRVVGVK